MNLLDKGSPLEPTLTKIFLFLSWKKLTERLPERNATVYYKRYVNDNFLLFNKPNQAQFFLQYINKKHNNMKFTTETEINRLLSFLDVKIFRENDKFVTSAFTEDTFSELYTNFISFVPLKYKFGLVCTLLNCFFLIYLLSFWNSIMKLINFRKFCRKMHTHKNLLINAFTNFLITCLFKGHKFPLFLKKNFYFKKLLPYLDKMFQVVKTRLSKKINKHMKFCKFKVIVQTNNKLRNYFIFKDFVPETLRSSLVYKFSCRRCTASYIGYTYRHFKVKVSNEVVSPRRVKPGKGVSSSSVRYHMLVCDHKVVHEDFKFLGNESNRYLLALKVHSLTEVSHHFNKNLHSQELSFFWVSQIE